MSMIRKHPQSADEDSHHPPQADRVVSRSPTFVSLYTNDVQVMTSPWDLRMILGELGDPVFPTSVQVLQLGEIRMSPQIAKKLTMILIDQLRKYEQFYGVIPSPDEDAGAHMRKTLAHSASATPPEQP